MGPVIPVRFVTPDGVERWLRFTNGAQKRITEKYGGISIQDILLKYGDGALSDLVFFMMFSERGEPPADLTPELLAESLPGGPESSIEMVATVMSAVTQGRAEKKEIEALLQKAMEPRQLTDRTGSDSGALPGSASDSPTMNSGGDTPNGRLPPLPTDTPSASVCETTAPE